MSGSGRDWRLYADDILEACEKIRQYIDGMTYQGFLEDARTRDAVLRNLEIVGEAAKRLPAEATALAPGVEWRKVRGMRDILAHAYFGLDNKVVWDTAATKAPEVQAAVRRILASAID